MTDLSGTQISSLLETLPGIAQVLRSPVADAFIGLIKAGSGQAEFNLAHAEEVLRYAVRRNLLGAEESEQILAQAREAAAGRKAAAAAQVRAAARAARPAKKAAARKPAKKAAARPAARARKPVRKPVKKAAARSHKKK